MGNKRAAYRRRSAPTPPRRSTTAPPSPNPAYQFQPIQLSAQRVKEVYALKLNQAPEEMRAAIRAKRMLSLMQSVLEHDGDATAEYARLKYLMEGLEDEYPDDPEKQAQRFLDYVDATTGKRQQHEANAPVRDRAFAKRLRSVTSFIQDNLKVPEEEEQIMETLLHTGLDKIKQSLYKDGRLEIGRPETPDLYCDSPPLSPVSDKSQAPTPKDFGGDSKAENSIAIIKATPAVKTMTLVGEQLDKIKIEPSSSKPPKALSRCSSVTSQSQSSIGDIEDLDQPKPESVCPWCSQPCRDPAQGGECDGPTELRE